MPAPKWLAYAPGKALSLLTKDIAITEEPPDIQVPGTHTGQDLALQLAETERDGAGPQLRQRGQSALPISSIRRTHRSPYSGRTPDYGPSV